MHLPAQEDSAGSDLNTTAFGDIEINAKLYTLNCNGIAISLPLKEYQIIELLTFNADQIMTKERIIELLWGTDSNAEYNNVEVHISYLRKKLNTIGAKTKIRTIKGVGYILEQY